MKAGRIVLASLLGGLVVFAWGAIEHMVTPLGHAGFQSLPSADSIMPAMKSAMPARGLYVFPGMPPAGATESDMKQLEARMQQGPNGLILFNPDGVEMMSPRQLYTEFASNVASSFILALILCRMRTSKLGGGLVGLGLGLFAWLSIEVSHWNWYGFPTEFALAALVEHTVGGLLAGLVVAAVLGRPREAIVAR